jgi:fatty acid desaturase
VPLHDVLSRSELDTLLRRSDLRAAWTLLVNWGLIALALALCAAWPNPATILVAVVLLGNRQLGLAVLTHDCGHGALFRSRRVNRTLGRWLCAAPVFVDLDAYFRRHARHHRDAGSHDDPDLGNYVGYAVTKDSFRRKIVRDLTGRTGVKTLAQALRFGGWRFWWRPLLANGVLVALCVVAGRPWLYLLWLGAWLTTNMLFLRLRQAAEHAAVPDLFDPDPRKHTRTTLASWWERLTLAPNHVNFHLEHHLLPSVPPYRLATLHRLLRARGFHDESEVLDGYRAVLGKLTCSGKLTRADGPQATPLLASQP